MKDDIVHKWKENHPWATLSVWLIQYCVVNSIYIVYLFIGHLYSDDQESASVCVVTVYLTLTNNYQAVMCLH